jgi:hypothetical protein
MRLTQAEFNLLRDAVSECIARRGALLDSDPQTLAAFDRRIAQTTRALRKINPSTKENRSAETA